MTPSTRKSIRIRLITVNQHQVVWALAGVVIGVVLAGGAALLNAKLTDLRLTRRESRAHREGAYSRFIETITSASDQLVHRVTNEEIGFRDYLSATAFVRLCAPEPVWTAASRTTSAITKLSATDPDDPELETRVAFVARSLAHFAKMARADLDGDTAEVRNLAGRTFQHGCLTAVKDSLPGVRRLRLTVANDRQV